MQHSKAEPIRILFDQLPTYPVNSQSLEKNKAKSCSMDADHSTSPDQQYSIRHYNNPQPYIAKKTSRQLTLDINNTPRPINRQTIDAKRKAKRILQQTLSQPTNRGVTTLCLKTNPLRSRRQMRCYLKPAKCHSNCPTDSTRYSIYSPAIKSELEK